MTLKQYLTIMILGTLLCWIAWGMVLINIDPFSDSGIGFAFFYVSLFFGLIGTVSIFSLLLRKLFSRVDLPMYRYVQKSFRDSLFFGVLLILLLYLQGENYLRWWNGGVLVGGLILYLSFIWSTKKEIKTIE